MLALYLSFVDLPNLNAAQPCTCVACLMQLQGLLSLQTGPGCTLLFTLITRIAGMFQMLDVFTSPGVSCQMSDVLIQIRYKNVHFECFLLFFLSEYLFPFPPPAVSIAVLVNIRVSPWVSSSSRHCIHTMSLHRHRQYSSCEHWQAGWL